MVQLEMSTFAVMSFFAVVYSNLHNDVYVALKCEATRTRGDTRTGYIVHVLILVRQDKGYIAGWDTLYMYW